MPCPNAYPLCKDAWTLAVLGEYTFFHEIIPILQIHLKIQIPLCKIGYIFN